MNLREAYDVPVPAIVLAEGAFGSVAGKTANGTVMHSEIFDTQVVVDSTNAGATADEVLGKADAPAVPVVESVEAACSLAPDARALIIGVAPAGGQLPEAWVTEIEHAIEEGCDVISGLHVFLNDQAHWRSLAEANDVRLFDVRKPDEEVLRVGDGSVDDADASVVLTLGTDCAVGKRTTTFELYRAARERGLNAGWVATGQTGIMVGAQRGAVIDRVPADFTGGVVEDMVIAVAEDHDLVFVEGQASLTHRAYSAVTLGVLHGSWPDAVVLADDPSRSRRTHFDRFAVDGIESERSLVESLSDATVVAVSTWGDAETETANHDLPAANVYDETGADDLLDAVLDSVGGTAVEAEGGSQ